ncbi:hypothetical protein F5X68DRAFT_42545 [Plectosphaerella plurivora]|uniref:RING-type E3 ubiquitin transferase n=1 Tax=Plectosphaerella plurivora TaxID=936078 RepID=A0A9P8V4R7_9PEZI|nr:hypothetical protein F5X68DRAFT_42545 [Plectosphaerella plurivora]
MASQSTGGRPGAPANEPEQVFCHACGNTWTKDVRGLVCPRCDSEATEVITAENNPRDFYDVPESPSDMNDGFRRADTDSDPGEADIEDLGPGGNHFHRHTWGNRAAHAPGAHDPRHPADLNDGEQVMARFLDLISGLGGARPSPRRAEPRPGWPPAPGYADSEAHPVGGGGAGSPFGGGGNVRTYTSRTGTGFTTFTIATGPINLTGGGARAGGRAPAEGGQDNDDFNTYVLRPHVERTPFGTRITMISIRAPANQPPSVFGNLLGGMAPPGTAAAAGGGPDVHQGGRPNNAPNLATSLGQLLSMLVPPGNGQMGDAVYTQEALDRIVSAMMEQNPQSNAAPPASEDAINKLEKRTVDDSMLEADSTAECTICIEELKKGDEVIYLPCKHWFHEQCAHLWLREHNTCPICRAAIEAADPAAGNNNSGNGGNAQRGAGPPSGDLPPFGSQTPGAGSGDYAPPPFPPPGQGGPPVGGWGAAQGPPPAVPQGSRPGPAAAHTWRWSFTYPPRPSMSPNPSTDRASSRTPSGYSINLPRPRRDSMSPPASAAGSRTRQRSPASSSWDRLRDHPEEQPQAYLNRLQHEQLREQQHRQHQQQQREQQQQQSGSSGPFSWLRHQLSRASGSGSGAGGNDPAPGPGPGPDSRSGDDWAREQRRQQ